MIQYLLVGVGCFLGGCLRNFFSKQWNKRNRSYPIGTFIANVLGSFLIGLFFDRFSQVATSLYLFLATGFCGGLTSFSTFNYEVINDFTNGNSIKGFYYWIGSFFCSTLAVFVGLLYAH